MRPSSVIVPSCVVIWSILQPLTACVPTRHGSDVAAVPRAGGPWHTTFLLDHPLVGRIYSATAGSFVPRDEVVQTVRARRFVLLGEKHDNVDHHRLQAELLRSMVEGGRRPALVVEMIDVDQQATLDDAIARSPHDAKAIGSATRWEARGWPPFGEYAPIFEVALDARLPIAGGDFPASSIKSLFHGETGGIDDATRARLGVDAPLAAPLDDSLRHELVASHCGMLAGHEDALPAMELAQRLRDGSMAATLADRAKDGAVLVAGFGHVRTDRGVPLVLRDARKVDPRAIVSVAFVEVERGLVDPKAYSASFFTDALPFDYVWFTPRVDENDPCAAMKKP